MIAIDDSLSMVDEGNVSGALALEAVATISKALTQLEVGDVAVCKFGTETTLLHPFERPLTDEAGASFVSQLTFQQERTNYAHAVESLVGLLDGQQQSASLSTVAVEYSQLAFIISDGRLNEPRQNIRRWVQEAKQRQQLLVLVILDSGEQSLSTMQLWDAKAKRAVPYLQDYPFDHYLLVGDVMSLPTVLSEAIKTFVAESVRAQS